MATYDWNRPFLPVGRAFFANSGHGPSANNASSSTATSATTANVASLELTEDEIEQFVENKDYYRLLKLSGLGASPDEIRTNYRGLFVDLCVIYLFRTKFGLWVHMCCVLFDWGLGLLIGMLMLTW